MLVLQVKSKDCEDPVDPILDLWALGDPLVGIKCNSIICLLGELREDQELL